MDFVPPMANGISRSLTAAKSVAVATPPEIRLTLLFFY
jgi:hypothetical protein